MKELGDMKEALEVKIKLVETALILANFSETKRLYEFIAEHSKPVSALAESQSYEDYPSETANSEKPTEGSLMNSVKNVFGVL